MIRTTESPPEAIEARPIIPANRLIQFYLKFGDSHQVTGEGYPKLHSHRGLRVAFSRHLALCQRRCGVYSLPGSPSPNAHVAGKREARTSQGELFLGGNTDHGLAADAVRSRFWMGNYRSIIYNGLAWGFELSEW